MGVTINGDFSKTPEEVIEDVDKYLYKAKESGRNKICFCGEIID
jgi:PleD family two-component response regulator